MPAQKTESADGSDEDQPPTEFGDFPMVGGMFEVPVNGDRPPPPGLPFPTLQFYGASQSDLGLDAGHGGSGGQVLPKKQNPNRSSKGRSRNHLRRKHVTMQATGLQFARRNCRRCGARR